MTFQAERAQFEDELERHYGAYASPLASVAAELHALSAAHPEWQPCTRKAAGYEIMAHRCPDLGVRGSGHSAYFAALPGAIQDEIIKRTELRA